MNAQPRTEVVEVGTAGWGTMTADFNAWTTSAVDSMKRELANRSVEVEDDRPRTLRLAVTGAKLESTGFLCRCRVALRVETGDGRTVELSGAGKSAEPPVAASYAVSMVIAAALQDPTIRAYIER